MKAKTFKKEKLIPQKSGENPYQFCINEAWMANLERIVAIKDDKVLAQKAIYVPGAKPWFLFHLVVGRSRTHRYILSDGKQYHDIQGIRIGGSRSKALRHGTCKGPWKLVHIPALRSLNQTAKKVINKSIDAFWTDKLGDKSEM